MQVSVEAPGTACPSGGVKISGASTTAPAYACNRESGDSASVTAGAAGVNCPNGGVALQVGSDLPTYVCNGDDGSSSAATRHRVTTEPVSASCPSTTLVLESGVDTNGNGTLDANETTSRSDVCSAADLAVSSVGSTVTKLLTLSGSQATTRLFTSTVCPGSVSSSTTAYVDLLVFNGSGSARKVAVWTSAAAGGNLDTMLVAYARTPTSDAGKAACLAINDDCPSSNTVGCVGNFSALSDSIAPVIPASTGYTFRVQLWSTISTGEVQLNLRAIN